MLSEDKPSRINFSPALIHSHSLQKNQLINNDNEKNYLAQID